LTTATEVTIQITGIITTVTGITVVVVRTREAEKAAL
jgi:hypothetical protein